MDFSGSQEVSKLSFINSMTNAHIKLTS